MIQCIVSYGYGSTVTTITIKPHDSNLPISSLKDNAVIISSRMFPRVYKSEPNDKMTTYIVASTYTVIFSNLDDHF